MTTLTLDTLFADTSKESHTGLREIIISIKDILKESFIKTYSPSCMPFNPGGNRHTTDTKTQENNLNSKHEDEDEKEIKKLEEQIQRIKEKNRLTEEIQEKQKEIQELTTLLKDRKKEILNLEIRLNSLLEQIHDGMTMLKKK